MAGLSDLADLKYYLRRYDFPKSTYQALLQLEKLTQYQYTLQQQSNINEVINEFIFGEVENRGVHQHRFSAVQELQLLEVLCSYFETQKDESVQTSVFLALFSMHENSSTSHRSKLLAQLLSLGVAANNIAILRCGALWMMGRVRSSTVLEVTKNLVNDYFNLIPQAASLLKDLPKVAPLFTANFITSVTSLYTLTVNKDDKKLDLPPAVLLNQITSWIKHYPNLCLVPRLMNIRSVQNSPFVITPVSGLLSWTVLAPIISKIEKLSNGCTKSNSATEQQNITNEKKELISYSINIYSELHLALMESMLEMSNKKPLPKYTALISSDEIVSIIHQLKTNSEISEITISDDSLNRLGQALQVSLSQRELHGNISEIMTWINQLPPNR